MWVRSNGETRSEVKLDAPTLAQVVSEYGVGIDCHSRFIQICVLATVGATIAKWERRYSTLWEDLCEGRDWVLSTLSRALEERAPVARTLRYTLESTGAYHYPVMLAWEGDAHIINPLIANRARRKTDKLDAAGMALQSMMGVWPSSFVCTPQQETLRLVVAHRQAINRERTRLTNRMNNIVLRFGHTFAAFVADEKRGTLSAPHIFPIFEALAEGKLPNNVKGISPKQIPKRVQVVMGEIIERVNYLTPALARANRALVATINETEFVCHGGEIVKGKKILPHLLTIPGVKEVLASAWLSQVVDACRFKHAGQVGAFAGFDPSLMVSAGKTTSHTRRKGNKWLHFLIKQAAGNLIKARSEPFGVWGYAMTRAHKKGGYSRASGAVGRRIATALWVCHRDQVDFTYDKYRFWRAPEVPDIAVEEIGLPPRMVKLLVENGYRRGPELVKGFYSGELAAKKGVGSSCLVQVRQWIEKHRDSSCMGR